MVTFFCCVVTGIVCFIAGGCVASTFYRKEYQGLSQKYCERTSEILSLKQNLREHYAVTDRVRNCAATAQTLADELKSALGS